MGRQHCSSLCLQSEGHEHVANMVNALGYDFVGLSARAWPPQYSSPSLCEQSELQCFAPKLRRTLLFSKKSSFFLRFCISMVSGSALATEIYTDPHNRLLRRQHCSSLCSQSEGHEHVANMVSALGHNLVIFQPMLGRRNIRPPHFASKVSYSAGAEYTGYGAGAENAEYGAGAANAGYSVALQSVPLRLYPIFRAGNRVGGKH